MTVTQTVPVEVVTDRAYSYVRVIESVLPAAWHHAERYANNPVECDHRRLKARLRPMRGLKRERCARGGCCWACLRAEPAPRQYELGVDQPANRRVVTAFAELARAI